MSLQNRGEPQLFPVGGAVVHLLLLWPLTAQFLSFLSFSLVASEMVRTVLCLWCLLTLLHVLSFKVSVLSLSGQWACFVSLMTLTNEQEHTHEKSSMCVTLCHPAIYLRFTPSLQMHVLLFRILHDFSSVTVSALLCIWYLTCHDFIIQTVGESMVTHTWLVFQEGFKMGLTLEGTVFSLDPLDSRCWCQGHALCYILLTCLYEEVPNSTPQLSQDVIFYILRFICICV